MTPHITDYIYRQIVWFQALDYYRRVAQAVAEEVSFSGGSTLQRIRLQVPS